MAVQALEQVSNLYIMYSFTPQETRKKHSTITTDILARNSTMGNKHSQPEEITQPLVENAEEATRLSISAEGMFTLLLFGRLSPSILTSVEADLATHAASTSQTWSQGQESQLMS